MDLEMTINVTETGIKSQLLTALGIAQLIGHRGIIDLLTARQRSGTAQTTQVENLSPCLRPQGQALEDQPGLTSPLKTATQETPVLPSETPTLPPEKSNTTPSAAVIPATAKAEQPDTVASSASPDHSMQTLPDSPSAKTQSPLDAAKDELIQELLRKLGQDNLEPLEGIRLMMEVRATKSLDSLCGLYNRVAGIERQKERARRRKARDRVSPDRGSGPGARYCAHLCPGGETGPGCGGGGGGDQTVPGSNPSPVCESGGERHGVWPGQADDRLSGAAACLGGDSRGGQLQCVFLYGRRDTSDKDSGGGPSCGPSDL